MSPPEPREAFSCREEFLNTVLEEHKKWIEGRGGQRADLRRTVLKNTDMKGVNLMGADLREAFLDQACLNRADLRGADLRRAHLDQATLIGTRLVAANLGFASLPGVEAAEADFTEANLLRADLRKARLIRAVLRHSNLRQATLTEANLVRADFRGADLTGAEMGGAVLSGADLREGDLSGTRLFGANLLGADLSGANLDGADLREARLSDSRLMGSNLTGADLSGADLSGACLDGADTLGWGIRRTVCSQMLLTEAEAAVPLEPGDFEKMCLPPERTLKFSLSVPLGAASAFLAKCVARSINIAMGARVVALKGLEAPSTYETEVLLTCFERDCAGKGLRIEESLLEKAMKDYFQSNPLRTDSVSLGDMPEGSCDGVVDFGSSKRVFDTPWQVNPILFREAVFQNYQRLGKICRELHDLILSVIGTGASGSGRACGPKST